MPQGLLDLPPLRLGPGVAVMAGHAQAVSGSWLVSEGDLANKRVNVGVLQEGGERVPPGLGAGSLGMADGPRDGDERVPDRVRLDRTRVAPNRSSDP